jgi:pimeloyl-ACP methyl ester carboxylesterase
MTPGDSPELAVMTEAATTPAHRVVKAEGIAMSALVAEARQPRAVLVALHGGAATCAYFDAPNRPRLSLLRTGSALGFTVVALDRPGYGSSAAYAHEMESVPRRVDLAYAAVGLLLGARPRGAGVFVLGHSMGCVLAVQMAADKRGADLLGLEIAGIGRHYHPSAEEILGTRMLRGPAPDGTAAAVHDMIWGPDHLYPAGAGAGIYSASPGYEGDEVRSWPRGFPALAAGCASLHYSLGDHERVWRSGPAALADIAALFTASPRVIAEEQASGGHNLSLGLSAVAYHLKVLSFAEECVLARENTTITNRQAGAATPAPQAGG